MTYIRCLADSELSLVTRLMNFDMERVRATSLYVPTSGSFRLHLNCFVGFGLEVMEKCTVFDDGNKK